MSKGSKQPAATTQTTTTEFPSELRPYITDILERAKARAEAEEKAGYQPYTAPRIAGFEQEQLEAQQATKDIVGRGVSSDPTLSSAQTYYAPALGLTLGQAERFGAPQAAQYMSPYQQAVIDVEKREAARSFAPQMQQIGAQAVGAGGFGGSRQAILESEALRNQQQMLGDIQTRGTQQAYDRAQAAFEAQKARERGAAGSLAQMGAAIPGQAFKEIGALEAVGAGRRADAQRALDLGYSQFQEEQLFPTRTLQEYQSIVRGFPYTPNTYTSGFTTTPPASLAQNVLGIGTGIAGLAGAFGGFGAKEGGHLAKLAQGRRPNDADSETPIQKAYEEGDEDKDNREPNIGLLDFFTTPIDQLYEKTGRTFGETLTTPIDELKYRGESYDKEQEEKNNRNTEGGKEPNIGLLEFISTPTDQLYEKTGRTLWETVTTPINELKYRGESYDKMKAKAEAEANANTQAAEADAKSQSGAGSNAPSDTTSSLDLNLSTDVNKKDMKSGITDLNNLLTKVQERTTLTPEMLAYKNELKSLRKDLGKRESQKKEDLKKQKYLQLAQFGLNVLSADTSKSDLQIIGEAGKEPLSALGAITAKEAELGDETSAAKLEMLGKEAGVAEAEQAAERQKMTDSLAIRKAITDEVSNKIKLGEYGSGVGSLSASETSQLRQDIFGEYTPKMSDPADTSSLIDAESRAIAKWTKILDQDENYRLRINPAKANALLKQLTADEYRGLVESGKIKIGKDASALGGASNQNSTAQDVYSSSDKHAPNIGTGE